MKKSASNNYHYLRRGNSHSTKPFKTGANAHLATQGFDVDYSIENVAQEADRLASLAKERDVLSVVFAELSARNEKLNKLLKGVYTSDERAKLKEEKRLNAESIREMQQRLSEINRERRGVLATKGEHYEIMFIQIAANVLPRDLFTKIHRAAKDAVFGKYNEQEAA